MTDAPPTASPTLRVGTWNAREALPAGSDDVDDRAPFITHFVELLTHVQLDVLALQEVDFDDQGRSSLLDALSPVVGLSYVCSRALSPSAFVEGAESGVALASRHPLRLCATEKLPNPGLRTWRHGREVETFDKGYVSAVLDLDGMDVGLVSVHSFPFHWFDRDASDDAFAAIWEALVQGVAEVPGEALVLAGDFNAEDRELITRRTRRPLTQAVVPGMSLRRLEVDDILYSEPFALSGTPVVVPTASDHELLYVDLVRRKG